MDFSQFVQWGYGLIESLGYLGFFFVNLISCSSIFFPLPGHLLVFVFGEILNPFLVAISSAFGATFGEITAYGLGRGVDIFSNKNKKNILK